MKRVLLQNLQVNPGSAAEFPGAIFVSNRTGYLMTITEVSIDINDNQPQPKASPAVQLISNMLVTGLISSDELQKLIDTEG